MVGGSWSGGSILAPSTEMPSKIWRSRHLATIEVRNEQELAEPAHLAKRLVKQQATLANELQMLSTNGRVGWATGRI